MHKANVCDNILILRSRAQLIENYQFVSVRQGRLVAKMAGATGWYCHDCGNGPMGLATGEHCAEALSWTKYPRSVLNRHTIFNTYMHLVPDGEP